MILNLKQKLGEHKRIKLLRTRKYSFHFLFQLESYLDCGQCDLSELPLHVTNVRFPCRYLQTATNLSSRAEEFFPFLNHFRKKVNFVFTKVNSQIYVCTFDLKYAVI